MADSYVYDNLKDAKLLLSMMTGCEDESVPIQQSSEGHLRVTMH